MIRSTSTSIKTVRAVSELRAVLAPYRAAQAPRRAKPRAGVAVGETIAAPRIGLVPTMGALHAGHLSLIERAREECDVVVVSLFVNPSQFNERSDLDRYPRDEARDRELAAEAGADILFAPEAGQVYPPGFATSVEVFGLTDRLEGAARGAAHFRGVTTVVTKLLNMVGPDVAYFGQKDAQQALVIRRLVADLDLPVRIETCATVREADGLAMSSRNARLSTQERSRAVALFRGLSASAALAAEGERSAEVLLAGARDAMAAFDLEGGWVEYLELVDPATLEPVELLQRPALLVVAARLGETRLIDNLILEPIAGSAPDEPDTTTPTDALARQASFAG
jgi:pantoate--beta-alanine ligase